MQMQRYHFTFQISLAEVSSYSKSLGDPSTIVNGSQYASEYFEGLLKEFIRPCPQNFLFNRYEAGIFAFLTGFQVMLILILQEAHL